MVDLELRPPANRAGTAGAAASLAPVSAPRPGDEAPLIDLTAVVRDSPPWLVSAIVHMLVMIIFGLMFMQVDKEEDLLLDAGYADDFGDPVDESFDTLQNEFEVDDNVLTADNLPIVEDPLAMPNVTEVAPNAVMPSGAIAPTAIGMALTGREPGMKEALLKSYGGTGKTEGAVALGLRWLAAQQRENGLWSLSGPYADGSGRENPEAATAMALLAFQGAGYTPASDPTQPFTKVVRDGWKALLKRQHSDGRFFEEATSSHELYTQAQCTMALCELYAMTGDAVYYDAAQRAVDFCVKVQSPQGGWRYSIPPHDSDMSVTGWFVMALQSARMGGIEVPSHVFEKITAFLDTVQRGDEHGYDVGSRYAYMERDGATLTLTAEGLLCRQYLGWPHDDPRLNAGVEYLSVNLPAWNKRNVYYWYYATQVLHHMEGQPWRKWNNEMKVLLPAHQEKRGRERGSWDPRGDRWGGPGGRLYVTCLSLLTLEVYYRHLPMYRTGLFENVR